MSRALLCLSCGADLVEYASLCECDRARLEQRVRAAATLPLTSSLARVVQLAAHRAAERGRSVGANARDISGDDLTSAAAQVRAEVEA